MSNKKKHIKFADFFAILLIAFMQPSCNTTTSTIDDSVPPPPTKPGESFMVFVDDLNSPLWTKHHWCDIPPQFEHANFKNGVVIKRTFPDPKSLLETAYDDLSLFFKAGDIPVGSGEFVIETIYDSGLEKEAFVIETNSSLCRIIAGDTEGIRRGVYYLEDQMLRARGPFLEIGITKKTADIKRRISRCPFAPIKRPPNRRDELLDTVNYYPDNYLNRLAYEGVNGLWITVELFSEMVSSSYTMNSDSMDIEKRFRKLNDVVQSCLRYGIRIYLFFIEPRLDYHGRPVVDVEKYPEFIGANEIFFCPSSPEAYKYLYETIHTIFSKAPDLGGLINISHGERGTTCASSIWAPAPFGGKINCPRCKDKKPWEILHASLTPMEKGMRDASPDAELISWLYMPQPQDYVAGNNYSLGDWVYDIPAHTPENVILQFNFESGVTKEEFNKLLVGGDYWLTTPGPSERFVKIANIAKENGTLTSAKIQTSNNYELATVPYIPVPTLLYQKFESMKQLGVTHTLLAWVVGSYSGLMKKGAGLLSMNSYNNVDSFLESLASIHLKKEDVPAMVKAWELFGEAFSHYPLSNTFQYYGPVNDGIVWPLYLIPQDKYLSPTYQIDSRYNADVVWPPSGDRIGECLGGVLTLEETVVLCKQMAEKWDAGVKNLNDIAKKYAGEDNYALDIVVTKAIGVQTWSSYHILRFYSLRENMFRTSSNPQKLEMLKEMEHLVREEIKQSKEMIVLCNKDPRLGYHADAEGYKYYPAKLEWRIKQLKNVLAKDFPKVKQMISNNEELFPDYTGVKPEGKFMKSVEKKEDVYITVQKEGNWLFFNEKDEDSVKWASAYDENYLYFVVSDETGTTEKIVRIDIESRRLWPIWPVRPFFYKAEYKQYDGKLVSIVRIPWSRIGIESQTKSPIRINIQYGDDYIWKQKHPLPNRLLISNCNPKDLGWVLFK